MRETGRSGCPINLTLEILGDRWSLIVLRDIMFGNRRHFRELLAKSDEGIASNILADRLKRLVERGLLSRRDDATHKQKAIYSLTEMGIALVPVFAAMGDWAIRQACKDAAGWEPGIGVSVNVSPLQFREPRRLVDTVKEALIASGLSSRRLTLEITESLLIEDNKLTLSVLEELKALGVSFALDDFGTGYSALGYLSAYPIAQVKIDQSFARDVHNSEAPKAIIEAVCQLARRLQMNVVVEGIETEQQRIAVQLLGAQRAQGYLFGRPESLSTIRRNGGGRNVA